MPPYWLALSSYVVTAAVVACGCTSAATKTHQPVVTTRASAQSGVVAFLTRGGAPLLAFERATAPLATGSRPDRATCLHLRDVVLPKIAKSPDSLVALTRRVPDRTLANEFHTVVSLKIIIVLGCATGVAPTGAQDPKAFTSIRDDARRLNLHLAQSGVNI